MSFETLIDKATESVSDPDYDSRYASTRQLDTLGLGVPPATRVLEVSVNWCALVVDAMAEVLNVTGFTCATEGSDEFLRAIWSHWQRQRMGVKSAQAHIEAMIQGSGFVFVGRSADNSFNVSTVRTRDGIAFEESDNVITEAVARYKAKTDSGSEVERAAYYTPDSIEVFQLVSGRWGKVYSQVGCGFVPVIPLVNSTRFGDRFGRSDIASVKQFADSASRSFTLLQLATEILSMPQRWIAGGQWDNLRRPDGSRPSLIELYTGSYMFAPNPNVKMGQFPGADLSKVVESIKAVAEQVSATTGLPPSMLGFSAAGNPMSAEAMRTAKERFITRGERKQQVFGDAWAKWARVNLALDGVDKGVIEEKLNDLSVAWSDVSLPSVAARNQAILQAHSQGILSSRTAREVLPLTPEQRKRENLREQVTEKIGEDDLGTVSVGSVPKMKEDPDEVTPGNEDKAVEKGLR